MNKDFIYALKKEIDLAGITILPAYELQLSNPYHATFGSEVTTFQIVEKFKTKILYNQIQFCPLPLSVTKFSILYRLGPIFLRWIEYYDPMEDQIINQYDVILRI